MLGTWTPGNIMIVEDESSKPWRNPPPTGYFNSSSCPLPFYVWTNLKRAFKMTEEAIPLWSVVPATSVARLGDLLHFWQLFKAYCNNYSAQIVHISRHLGKGIKIFLFLWNNFWATFNRHLATFYWSRCLPATFKRKPPRTNNPSPRQRSDCGLRPSRKRSSL